MAAPGGALPGRAHALAANLTHEAVLLETAQDLRELAEGRVGQAVRLSCAFGHVRQAGWCILAPNDRLGHIAHICCDSTA